MTDSQEKQDLILERVVELNGEAVRKDVVKIKKLIDEYAELNFNTRKATADDIRNSFVTLQRIYTTALTTEDASRFAAMNYLARRFEEGRNDIFSPIRVNMLPPVEEGGSHAAGKFVADLNQFYGALILSSNANQLRSITRVDKILGSIRSPEHRKAIEEYVAAIDH